VKKHPVPLHPVTAQCRECDWSFEPMIPGTGQARRDLLVEEHVVAARHAVTISAPGFPGYAVVAPAV
jgi:hypothetical protein